MSKISREDNKKRYKTGMYPTQQDFENVFDSYVHKDDTIDPSKIVSGDENIVDIINRKAEKKHSHEIADVDGLQKFIDEMTALLEIVRDPETGEISESKLKTLTDSLTALRDDVDTNTDNVSGQELRITNAENNLEKVYQILGKNGKETIADLADSFAALTGNYSNVYDFVNKVKAFLEDSDASDETINRWQEIETFLQGITDTQTLTGLLADLKAEILAEIPEPEPAPQGNYLKQIADLDGYTDAQDGEIVQYVGQTTDSYTRGFFYERKKGDGGEPVNMLIGDIELRSATFNDGTDCGDITGTYHVKGILGKIGTAQKAVFFTAPAKVGDPVWIEGYGFTTVEEGDLATINYLDGQLLWEKESDGTLLLFPGLDGDGLVMYNQYSGNSCYVMQSARTPKARYTNIEALIVNKRTETVGGVAASSWQNLPTSPVVS